MNETDFLRRYLDKTVIINTKKGYGYTGVVQEVVDAGNGLIFISIIDKFDKWATFSSAEILSINEVKA